MARRSEEIDEVSGSGGDASTVMVGGMDNLIPGGKDKAEVIDVELDDPKPPPGGRSRARDDDEIEEDARLAYDVQDDDEIEERGVSRRQRRNRARKTVVGQRDQIIDHLNAKVDHLTGMINSMGQNQVGLTINNIDTQLGAAQQALTLAEVEIKKAVLAGDLARYDELLGLKNEAQGRVWQLARTRQGIQQEMSQGGRPRQMPNGTQSQPPQSNLDQKTQDFTETFMDRFDFDPQGTDERTLIIKAIDDSVAAEGYRSNTQQYWITLEKKLARRGILPDGDADVEDDNSPPRREAPARRANGGRPPTSGSQTSRRSAGRTFRLDPMARDYLDSEGLLHLAGLTEEQKAKRTRLLKSWDEGQRRLGRDAQERN
jgi:hypothetical protein